MRVSSLREMRAVFAALAANLGIAVTKFVAFLLTGSASMLAESVHSVADTGNQVLLLVGRGRSLRPPSDEHPFGFGRERYFYGFVVVGHAVHRRRRLLGLRRHPQDREPGGDPRTLVVAFVVLALSAVLEGFSLRTGIGEANKVRGDRNWVTFIRRTKAPELPVVLLEDLAALIGLGFAFAGVTLSWLTGNGRWDGAGSLAIGLLLATAAAILAVEMKSLLIGESASAEMQRMIVAALEDGPEVSRVIHMRTVHISPDSILVAAKIAVRATDTAAQIAAGIDAAERRVRAAVPIAETIYLEPDIYHPVPGRPDRPLDPRRAARPPVPALAPGPAQRRPVTGPPGSRRSSGPAPPSVPSRWCPRSGCTRPASRSACGSTPSGPPGGPAWTRRSGPSPGRAARPWPGTCSTTPRRSRAGG